MKERLIYVVEEVSGSYDDRSDRPCRAYDNYEDAKKFADELNAEENKLYKTVLALEDKLDEMGTDRDRVNEDVFREYLKEVDPKLLSDIVRLDEDTNLDLSVEDEQALNEYGEQIEQFLAGHKNGEYKKYALQCGFDEETIQMLEDAIEYDSSYENYWYYVSQKGITLYCKEEE